MAHVAVGTMVEVVDKWERYDLGAPVYNWQQVVDGLGLTKCRPAQHTALKNGDVGQVVGTTAHPNPGYSEVIVVGIHVSTNQQDYLINQAGLKVLPPAPPPPSAAIMETLWASRAETGDVRMKSADGQTIAAHACILSAASPVFARALTSGMKESITKEIVLPDTEFDVVQGVLEFLYLGVLPSPSEEPAKKKRKKKVLPASTDRIAVAQFAHKYSMEAVVVSLAGDLIKMINEENVASIVRLLKDFDKDGSNLIKKVIEAVGNDQAILTQVFLQL